MVAVRQVQNVGLVPGTGDSAGKLMVAIVVYESQRHSTNEGRAISIFELSSELMTPICIGGLEARLSRSHHRVFFPFGCHSCSPFRVGADGFGFSSDEFFVAAGSELSQVIT